MFTKTSVLCPGPYGFWEIHTALDGPRINQSNHEFLSCYTIKSRIGPPKKRIGPGNRRLSSRNKNKRDDKNFHATFTFFIESFTLNEIWELEKISVPTAAFKEDINMFSTEFREGFGLLPSLIMAIQ